MAIFNLKEMFEKYKISLSGIIHIGAWKGEEIADYRSYTNVPIIMIEANPQLIPELKNSVKPFNDVLIVNCAITNVDGEIDFHLVSSDQSSSILRLKRHSEVYPDIVPTQTIKVLSRKLDTLFREQNLDFNRYNFINIDIQGAELLAFKGAEEVLKNVVAINTEVNLIELYENCVILQDLDAFLFAKNFNRVEIKTPYHPTWGDAFYIKNKL